MRYVRRESLSRVYGGGDATTAAVLSMRVTLEIIAYFVPFWKILCELSFVPFPLLYKFFHLRNVYFILFFYLALQKVIRKVDFLFSYER